MAIFQFLAPKNYSGAFGYDDANSISPLSFGKSFMKIRSAVPLNGCLIFMHYRVANGKCKRQKKHLLNIYAFAPPSVVDA